MNFSSLSNATVQELLDVLNQIENKSKKVFIRDFNGDMTDEIEIEEYDTCIEIE